MRDNSKANLTGEFSGKHSKNFCLAEQIIKRRVQKALVVYVYIQISSDFQKNVRICHTEPCELEVEQIIIWTFIYRAAVRVRVR